MVVAVAVAVAVVADAATVSAVGVQEAADTVVAADSRERRDAD